MNDEDKVQYRIDDVPINNNANNHRLTVAWELGNTTYFAKINLALKKY